jgi:hypothetical protein
MKARINVAMPVYGSQFTSAFMRSMFPLLLGGSRQVGFSFSEIDYSDIVVSRNYLISNFYFNKKDCSHILMVDCDMGFPAELVGAMLAFDKPVVGVIYPKRQVDLRKLHAQADMPFERALARSLDFVGSIRQPRTISGSFMRMDWCGAGILLISRQCVDAMVASLPEIVDDGTFRSYAFGPRFKSFLTPFDKIRTNAAELPEDKAFCSRWVEGCGGEIWACCDRKISHVGTLTVSAAYSDLWK